MMGCGCYTRGWLNKGGRGRGECLFFDSVGFGVFFDLRDPSGSYLPQTSKTGYLALVVGFATQQVGRINQY